MPTSAPRICAKPGCHELVTKGHRCAKHKIVRQSTTQHQSFYTSARWRRLRKMQLRREPLCKMCKENGKLVTATDVDHIVPHDGQYALMYDMENLQSLCRPCHSRKTMAENKKRTA